METDELRKLAPSVLAEDLDQTGYVKILLFRRWRLPVVWFPEADDEACVSSPVLLVCLLLVAGHERSVGLNCCEFVQVPRLANRECA